MSELLNCPFCGGDAIFEEVEPGGWVAMCLGCGVSTHERFACGDDPLPLLGQVWNRRATPSPEAASPGVATYDAGLLSDWGGGNVEWWQNYIRNELERAHEFYVSQLSTGEPSLEGLKAEIERLTKELASEERGHSHTIDQRDAAEEALAQAYFLVTGVSPPYSSAWSHADAVAEIDDACSLLRQASVEAQARADDLTTRLAQVVEALARIDRAWSVVATQPEAKMMLFDVQQALTNDRATQAQGETS